MLNPRLSQLRDHPRFAAIEMGSRAQYRQAHGLIEAAHSRGELPVFLKVSLDELDRELAWE